MINEIKEMLINNPEKIVELLETFSFEHIHHRNTEIRFARSDTGGANISIRLKNNPYCVVSDWSRGVSTDIVSYIIREKNATFRDVLQTTKKILGLGDDWRPHDKKSLFNGIYDNVLRPNRDVVLKTYDESILDQYERCGNLLWLNEGISLEAQRFYNVGFDIENNGIVFPWRNDKGEIICVKSRYNGTPPEGVSKYYYPISSGNVASGALFNYSECYEYLYGADVVYCVESEKTCMKMWGWNIKNCVAIGSHSLSVEQIKLLLQLNCKEICILLDKDLPFIETKKNADNIRQYTNLMDTKISYWNWTYNLDLGDKCAPVDGTYEQFQYILKEEIEPIEKLDKEFEEDDDDL